MHNDKIQKNVEMSGMGKAMVALGAAVLLTLAGCGSTAGLNSFSDLVSFVASCEEYPKIENEKPLKPDFGEYWKAQVPGFFSKMMASLGLGGSPAFSVAYFKHQLETLTASREKAGMKEDFIVKLDVSPGDTFIMWGDLQGAYHSFVRGLQKVKDLGYMDEQFKLVKPNTFFVIMGDAISRSAYSMETLSVIMKLLEANPDRAFYMMGGHEAKGAWRGHSLKRELEVQAAHVSSDPLPLGKEVDAFFNTLPRALYLGPVPPTHDDFVRVSSFGRVLSPEEQVEHKRLFGRVLKEEAYSQFLVTDKTDGVAVYDLSKGGDGATQINIKAVIKGEKKRETYQPHKGLRLMKPELGSTAWTMLASPTEPYQKLLKFKYDAFSILKVGSTSGEWTITLYSQDATKKDGFSTTKYNFFSGKEGGAESAPAAKPPADDADEDVSSEALAKEEEAGEEDAEEEDEDPEMEDNGGY